MYWQEETEENQFTVPGDVVDLQFQINCPTLPVDHAWALSRQIQQILPWFADEAQAGLHIIHGADSGNGWERPQGAGDLLYLSRRTRLELRLPSHRVSHAEALSGAILEIAGHSMKVGSGKTRKLSASSVLYSRYVATDPDMVEEEFTEWAVDELKELRLRFKKILCGRSFELATPEGPVQSRSLMVADLPFKDAVILQERGIGPRRSMGCGLFIPQKSF